MAADSGDPAIADSVGFIQITPRGTVTHANEAFLSILAYTSDALPLRLDHLTPIEWQPWDRACLANLMLSRRPVWYHKEFIARDGRLVPALVILAFGVRADQGFVATVIDLSTPAGDAAPREPRLSPLLQIALDVEGNIYSINPAGAEQLGYAVDELVGRPGSMVFEESDWRAIRDELRSPSRWSGACREGWSRRRRRDGSILAVSEQVRMATTTDGRHLRLFVSSATGNPEATARTILECQNRIERLTAELSEIKESERERFSIGLHDEVAQPLAVARLKLGALSVSLTGGERERITSIMASVDQAIQATRSLTMELNSRMLAGPGLTVALRRLGERMMAESDIEFEFSDEPLPVQPDQETSLTLFRAVRELLRNVVKHSGASRTKLVVAADTGTIRIAVQDNGHGFKEGNSREGVGRPGAFGLFSVHEQLTHLGGRLEIFNAVGEGARVVMTVPLFVQPSVSV
jgi:PAS domain S-box-containing protein